MAEEQQYVLLALIGYRQSERVPLSWRQIGFAEDAEDGCLDLTVHCMPSNTTRLRLVSASNIVLTARSDERSIEAIGLKK